MTERIVFSKDSRISQKEADVILAEEKAAYQKRGQELAEMRLELDGEEIIVKSRPKSNISRVRRITGYLSSQNNFNDAKKRELADRRAHD